MKNISNILVFIDWYYPGYKAGGPVRSCLNMVEHLKVEFNFYIVTRNTEYTETIPYKNIRYDEWVDGPNGEKVIYLTEGKQSLEFYSSLMEEKEYDSIMIMGLFSKKFSIFPLKAANRIGFRKIIVSPRGMLAPGALKIKQAKKKIFLSWAKMTGFYNQVIFHGTNSNEEMQVKKHIRKFQSIVIAENFPRKINPDQTLTSGKIPGELRLISVARIAPEKNTLFALEILKDCKTQIRFDIYGSIYDESYWKKCKEAIAGMPSNIKVNYSGDLPSDRLFDILPKYDFLFLPTRGENFGHIILESFMCGLPVIISDQTPWKDLKKQKLGFDFPLEERRTFVDCLNEISNWDPVALMEWKNAAFEYGKMKSDVVGLKNKYIKLLG